MNVGNRFGLNFPALVKPFLENGSVSPEGVDAVLARPPFMSDLGKQHRLWERNQLYDPAAFVSFNVMLAGVAKSGTNFHEDSAEHVPSRAVASVAPETVVLRVLDDAGVSGRQQKSHQFRMLLELCADDFPHDIDLHRFPVTAEQSSRIRRTRLRRCRRESGSARAGSGPANDTGVQRRTREEAERPTRPSDCNAELGSAEPEPIEPESVPSLRESRMTGKLLPQDRPKGQPCRTSCNAQVQ